jgi:hypothetical protein
MDGVTKQLEEYFESLGRLGDLAVEAVKEQIDIETERTEAELRQNTPKKTGGLAASLTRTNINTPKRYGHRLEYAGADENGVPYEKVANILNYGTSTIAPRRFVTRTVKKLKGLDDRAAARFEDKTKNLPD